MLPLVPLVALATALAAPALALLIAARRLHGGLAELSELTEAMAALAAAAEGLRSDTAGLRAVLRAQVPEAPL